KPVRAGPAMTPSVELADFGSFFAGGRPVRIAGEPTRTVAFTRTASLPYDPNGHYHFEQAYVQYFIPARRRQPLPLVLLHGGGIGWTPCDSVWPERPIIRSAEESWTLFRFGAADGFAERRGFDGQRFPIQAFDAFIQHAVPRWLGNNDAALRGLCAVLDRVGPCLLVAHSHGGEVAFRALQQRPALVRGLIAIEPSGFTESVETPAVAGKPFLFVYGDYLDAT